MRIPEQFHQFQELLNFFAAYFPDADLEGLSDEQVVEEYLKTVTQGERTKVIEQCGNMLAQPALPLDLIADQAWRKFPTQAECRQWLEAIDRKLRGNAEANG